jgi:hypothetical protein
MRHSFDWNDVHEDAGPQTRPVPERQPVRIGAVIGWFFSLLVFIAMLLNQFILPAIIEAKKEQAAKYPQPDPPRATLR